MIAGRGSLRPSSLVMSAATTTRCASLTLTVAAIAAVTIATVAQTFEVASIKLNKALRGPLTSVDAPVFELPMAVMPGGRFRLRLVPTRTLIQLAYGVRSLVNRPGSMTSAMTSMPRRRGPRVPIRYG